MHTVHAIIQVLDTLSGLWREEFEGEGWTLFLRRLAQFWRDVHTECVVMLWLLKILRFCQYKCQAGVHCVYGVVQLCTTYMA